MSMLRTLSTTSSPPERATSCKHAFVQRLPEYIGANQINSVIGREKPWISLPKGKGVKLSIADERDRRRAYALAGH